MSTDFRIISLDKPCPIAHNSVLSMGNFEGVHRGHQHILAQAINYAKNHNTSAGVLFFYPHPKAFFQHEKIYIQTLRDKLDAFSSIGLDFALLIRFNKIFAAQTADTFLQNCIRDTLRPQAIFTGQDVKFGHKQQGHADTLKAFGKQHNIHICTPKRIYTKTHEDISSSRIRHLLAQGDIPKVNTILGRTFSLTARVHKGTQKGRTIGFPTLNVSIKRICPIKLGVYTVSVKTQEDPNPIPAVANIGIRPTLSNDTKPLLEVHMLDTEKHMYGQLITVYFHTFIRPEKTFDSIQSLQRQITKDAQKARTYHANNPPSRTTNTTHPDK